MAKKMFLLLLSLILASAVFSGVAEETAGNGVEYTGGVIFRSFPKNVGDTSEINVAYIRNNLPYIVVGEMSIWELAVEGGAAPYSISLQLYHQELSDGSNMYWSFDEPITLDGPCIFTYTFEAEGRYFWEISIADSEGQCLIFQSRPMTTSSSDEEVDAETVVGKVNQIIASQIDDSMSDYARALVLHDWLIYNANYDFTYSHYDPSGVLLYGTGVCDSYSRAYQMLCTAAGIECLYVTGTADGGSHGWNLVKIDGEWYHVDCTWDDPGMGGYERHDYFMLTDEQMAVDHCWNLVEDSYSEGMIVPDAEGSGSAEDDSLFAEADLDFLFSDLSDLSRKFDDFVQRVRISEMKLGYIGDELPWDSFIAWAEAEQLSGGRITGIGCLGRIYTIWIQWEAPDSYLRIEQDEMVLTIHESTQIVPSIVSPEDEAITWTSSNSAVASVDGEGRITAIGEGEATIGATLASGYSDSVHVTVLPAHNPDMALQLTRVNGGVLLSWNLIPGVTEYQIIRQYGGSETVLKTAEMSPVTLSGTELPENILQQVYIVANRRVGEQIVVTYTSEKVQYGSFESFEMTVPAGITTICDSAFEGATFLSSIRLPDSLVSIGAKAFYNCSRLTVISIPSSVTFIGSNAFDGTALTAVVVAEGSYADRYFAQYYPDVMRVY